MLFVTSASGVHVWRGHVRCQSGDRVPAASLPPPATSHTAAGATHLQLARTDINIHSGALAEPRRIVVEAGGLVLFWAALT